MSESPVDAVGVLQDAFVPPFVDPLQAQVHGPVPLSVVGVPAVQRPVVGGVVTATPFAGPQTPLMAVGCSGAFLTAFRGSACADSTKNKRQKAAREIPLIIVRFPFGRWLRRRCRGERFARAGVRPDCCTVVGETQAAPTSE